MYNYSLSQTPYFDVIYKPWDAVFHHHADETLRRELKIQPTAEYIFDELRGASSGDETLCWMLFIHWYFFSNKMILPGEIKDAKINSFSSDFQTLLKH